MFDVHCSHCDRRYLVGTRSIDSFHNTSDGPVAYGRCPRGHRFVRYFHRIEAPAPATVGGRELATEAA